MAKGLMGPVSVVTLLLLEQLGSQLAERVGWVNQLVKLLFVGALGSFHAAVELGGAWWQHKKPQPLLLTGGLKLGPELKPPAFGECRSGVDLRSSASKRLGGAGQRRLEADAPHRREEPSM